MISLPKDQQDDPQPTPGSSRAPFRGTDTDLLVEYSDADGSPPPLEPPPDFAPYRADYFEVGYEEICSHDSHLNSDGEALYRFLLERSQRPPFVRVAVRGTHTETRTRWVTHRDQDGRHHQKAETYTETITDFDFCFDAAPPLGTKPIQWSVPDSEPAYRGKMVREVERVEMPALGGVRRPKKKATRSEKKSQKRWDEERRARGLPPWCTPQDVEVLDPHDAPDFLSTSYNPIPSRSYVERLSSIEANSLRSSKTLRQWADEYCNSPKYLKEFVYEQHLYGWNMEQIENAIRTTVLATPYNGNLEISFTRYRSRIYIRPNNRMSKLLSNKWLVFLLVITLIYPFIWLYKRFHSRGGGKWQVCGAAYPMKKWVPASEDGAPLPPTVDDMGLPLLPAYTPYDDGDHTQASSSSPSSPYAITMPLPSTVAQGVHPIHPTPSRLMQTSSGPKKLMGIREGEWFRKWEPSISRAVLMRHQSSTPLQDPNYRPGAIRVLDGYMP